MFKINIDSSVSNSKNIRRAYDVDVDDADDGLSCVVDAMLRCRSSLSHSNLNM
jgi:hypothetical protein